MITKYVQEINSGHIYYPKQSSNFNIKRIIVGMLIITSYV